MQTRKLRILLADDHSLVREGFRLILDSQSDMQVVGEAGNGKEAVTLAEELQPDVVVMDVTMPELNGIEATRRIGEVAPRSKVLALSMHRDTVYVREILKAGAKGYLLKASPRNDMLEAIRSVACGDGYLSPAVSEAALSDYRHHVTNPIDRLTSREREVLQLVAEGRTNKEIATLLGISVYTVEAHRSRILEITAEGAVIRKGKDAAQLRFVGARKPSLVASKPQQAKYHLYRGNARAENLPMYGEVRQNGLYRGIDAVYYGSQSNLEYDFVVHAGADPSQIRFRFDGAKVRLAGDGSLAVDINGREWRQKAPLAFQQAAQRFDKVEARYVVSHAGEISLAMGDYDQAKDLIIDPVLTEFGNVGAVGMTEPLEVAVDAQGNVYAGDTIDVAKFDSQGVLVYQFHAVTNAEDELLQSIAVAADGGVVVGGMTDGKDLPTSANVFQPNKDVRICFPAWAAVDCILEMKRADGFVIRLNPNGTLQWATYLGAGDRDNVTRVAFGPNGTVHTAGETRSNFFPTKNEFQGCGTFPSNAFFTVLRADGTDIAYSTCLHPTANIGDKFSMAMGLAVDSSGFAYVAGHVKTGSGEFPVQGASGAAPFQSQPGGGIDGFIAKFNPAAIGAQSLVYSTFIGGSADDKLESLTLDSGGAVCAAGHTKSSNYPKLAPAGTNTPLNAFRGPVDLIVTCLSANGGTLTFSNVYGIQSTTSNALPPTHLQSIQRDAKGGLHIADRSSGSFTAVNPFDNAGGQGTGTYLRLRAATRVVQVLSHTVEKNGSVAVDSQLNAFLGTQTVIRRVTELCAPDVTGLVQVIQGNIIFDVATGRFRQSITLRSLIPVPIGAGARLVFTQLPAGVAVFQAAASTTCFAPPGSPFVVLPTVPPSTAGTASITVEFTSSGAAITYFPRIAAPGDGV